MSIEDYATSGGAIVIFGLTILVLLKEYLAPWLARVLVLKAPQPKTMPLQPAIRGTVIFFGEKR